ncbi:MAG: AAA family ATPase [Nitrospira sp.]|nr:AAA family ATPase [Nitrospira sp.]
MIHSLSVSNFRSIREEAVLDLRIPKTAPDLPRFRQSQVRPDIRLPPVVVLMGPNGSGKTTLLRALDMVIRIVRTPWREDETPVKRIRPFFSPTFRDKQTRFCLELEADWLAPGVNMDLFRYELSVHGGQIMSEALLHFPKGRPRRLFYRGTPGEPIYFSREFGITSKDNRLKAVRSDVSVIATLTMTNVPLAMRIASNLRHSLLTTNVMYDGDWRLPTEALIGFWEINSNIREQIKQALQRSDLAIHDVNIQEIGGTKHVLFDHHALDTPIPLRHESGGTQRLFHLWLQLFIALELGLTAVIDEIDDNLHVDIVRELFHNFQSQETNPRNAQLFVTAHNVGLLDDLEKEELFIVEKGEDCGTRVHGAQDVQGLRRDTRLYSKYRLGVLGGIPQIG